MDKASQLVLKKQQNRYKMLKAVYEAGSSEYRPVNFYDIGKELGLVREEINDAELYLLGQGLITRFDDQGGVRLMHRGTVEVENSIQHPNKPTEHFSTQVIQPVQNFYGAVGAVQTASYSTASVTQNIGVSAPEEISDDIAFLDKHNKKASPEPEKRKSMTRRIFISHSHGDAPLVALLVDLLKNSLVGIQSKDIRCTSLPGYQLHPGAPTSTTLKEEIKGCEVLIGVITKNSLNSSYVLFELGASWLADKYPIGLLGPGKSFRDLPAILGETNGIRTYERHDLENLIDHIASVLNVDKESTALISSKINGLVNYREPEQEQNQNPY